jgi:hypothetical protein
MLLPPMYKRGDVLAGNLATVLFSKVKPICGRDGDDRPTDKAIGTPNSCPCWYANYPGQTALFALPASEKCNDVDLDDLLDGP